MKKSELHEHYNSYLDNLDKGEIPISLELFEQEYASDIEDTLDEARLDHVSGDKEE